MRRVCAASGVSFVMALACSFALAAHAAAADAGVDERGTVAGLVVNSNGSPYPGVCVRGTRTSPEPSAYWSTTTDATGHYSTSAEPGDFEVEAHACGTSGPFIPVYYPGTTDRPGDPVRVTAGKTTTANIRIPRIPSISGRVIDQFGRPVQGACPRAIGHPDPAASWAAQNSGSDGRYTLSTMRPSRSYKVMIYDCANWPTRFGETWWHGPDQASAEPIALGEADRTDIDFQIVVGGQIAGRVTNDLGEPLSWVCVSAVEPDGDELRLAISGADGVLRSGGVPQGEYGIVFRPCGSNIPQPNSEAYAPEYWDDEPTVATAKPVALGYGDTPLLNVELTVEGPEPCTVPAVKGERVRRATRMLSRADCGVAPLAEAPEAGGRKRVIASRPREGAVRRHGTKVKLSVASRQ